VGDTARALAGRHTGLDALWGAEAARLQERLMAAPDDEAAMTLVEEALVARLRAVARPPGLREVLVALDAGASVGAAAALVGRSPRAVGLWFDESIGVSPVAWARLRRMQRALRLAHPSRDWATVAAMAGFADQAHLSRELQAIAGLTPTAWRAGHQGGLNHVPIVASDSFKPGDGDRGTDGPP
jgi:AraC-like DNA-binding protein